MDGGEGSIIWPTTSVQYLLPCLAQQLLRLLLFSGGLVLPHEPKRGYVLFHSSSLSLSHSSSLPPDAKLCLVVIRQEHRHSTSLDITTTEWHQFIIHSHFLWDKHQQVLNSLLHGWCLNALFSQPNLYLLFRSYRIRVWFWEAEY